MSLPNELALATEIIQKAKEEGITLQGPVETEYGFGWIPTVTIWHGDRRVHFHYSFQGASTNDKRNNVLTLEAGFTDNAKPASRTPVTTLNEAWDIVKKFLIVGLLPEDIECEWVSDTTDRNKFIPNPPDKMNSANIASLFSRGTWTRWKPSKKD
jgi:hypothetical protein